MNIEDISQVKSVTERQLLHDSIYTKYRSSQSLRIKEKKVVAKGRGGGKWRITNRGA